MSQAPTRDELDAKLARTAHLGKDTRGLGAGPVFIKANELLEKELPEHRWAVRGVLAEGCSLLVGRTKIGKSWLAFGLALAIASGGVALGRIRVDAGDVLYLSLEDNERRLKSRLTSILNGARCPDRLTLSTSWPKLDERGLPWLEAWADRHPAARLIIVDTLEKVRPAASKNGRLYGDDYAALSGLQQMAGKRGLTILVLHHTRKMASDDPLETISGTTGLSGAADSVLILKRERGHRDATLFVTGRDVEETELTLRWDQTTTTWHLRGQAEISDERTQIINALRVSHVPMSPSEIAKVVNKPYAPVKLLTWRMANEGQLVTDGKGHYSISSNPGYLSNHGNPGYPDTVERVSEYPGIYGSADTPLPGVSVPHRP